MNRPETRKDDLSNDEVVERARRALIKAGERAMADYKRFGIDPVISEPGKKSKSANR